MVNKNTMVKAVQRLKPIDIVFNMPDMDKANINVNIPIKTTNVLFITMSFSLFILGFIKDLYISWVNNVDAPKSKLQAVDTSAAQRAAKVKPAAMGFRDSIILGRARVALTLGKEVLAAMPIKAHKNPIGIMRSPAIINPLFAVFESLAAKANCTGPCMDITCVIIMRNQLKIIHMPVPSTGLK